MECQKCRKFPVIVMKEKVFKECAPVYDEECSTTYDKHCKVKKKCVEIYQTQCTNSGGYTQTCSQVPAQTCYPETVCHRQCSPLSLIQLQPYFALIGWIFISVLLRQLKEFMEFMEFME